ncbi:hypothetical protein [Tropicimonas aquimaris]|uniref:DUF1206 domain-containing protein n=1 Tax=Tropicimonas aquimaris TaxID=914152 RepID=A0ABW3IRW6_9RHOB
MLSIFLEHQSPKAARRALLISSTLTVFFASLEISGGALDFLGLEIQASQENVVVLLRVVTGYFLYVFSWFTLEFYLSHGTEIRSRALRNRADSLGKVAQEIDSFDPATEGLEPDDWWIEASEAREKSDSYQRKRQAWIEVF